MTRKRELELQVASLEIEKKTLIEQNTKLLDQVSRLQDGLLNIRAPEAYRDMIADKTDISITSGLSEKEQREMEVQRQVATKWLDRMEGPTWEDADEMVDSLTSVLNRRSVEAESPHGNNES